MTTPNSTPIEVYRKHNDDDNPATMIAQFLLIKDAHNYALQMVELYPGTTVTLRYHSRSHLIATFAKDSRPTCAQTVDEVRYLAEGLA